MRYPTRIRTVWVRDFTGKHFDVNTFAEILCERIPENRVLSHDLLEGGFLRAGLLSDIELIDEYPSHSTRIEETAPLGTR